MKIRMFALLLSGMLGLTLLAEDIELTDGRKFLDASIKSETALRVVIKHKGGLTGVNKSVLPPALAAKYPANPEKAAENDQRDQAVRAAREKEEAASRARARAQAEARINQEILDHPQVQAALDMRNRAMALSTRMVGEYFTKRYTFASGQRAYCAVSVQDVSMIDGNPTRWRISGSVIVHASRAMLASGTSAERAQFNADDVRGLQPGQSSADVIRQASCAYEADVENLDGTPTISIRG